MDEVQERDFGRAVRECMRHAWRGDAVHDYIKCYSWAATWIHDIENDLTTVGLSTMAVDPRWGEREPVSPSDLERADQVRYLVARFKHLDLVALGMIPPDALLHARGTGIDGQPYCIVRIRRFPLVDPKRASDARWPGSVRSLAKQHACVEPAGLDHALQEPSRLGTELSHARSHGSILLYPLATHLTVRHEGDALFRVEVDDAGHDKLVAAALRDARDRRATILVLPELSLRRGIIEGGSGLRRQVGGRWPILTVAGLEHGEDAGGRLRNRAVIIDRWGKVVGKHDKMTKLEWDDGWEAHLTAGALTAWPSALGTIALAICRDLFADPAPQQLVDRRADVVLVPSLSPKTTEHEVGANWLRQRCPLASTFVANRWGLLSEPMHPPRGRSLAVVPGDDGGVDGTEVHRRDDGAPLHIDWG